LSIRFQTSQKPMKLLPEQSWTTQLGWGLLVIIAYPLLTLILSEWLRRQGETSNASIRRLLGVVQTLLLPVTAMWIVIVKLTGFSSGHLLIKLADTAISIVMLYSLFVMAREAIRGLTTGTRAPRLLYDIALSLLVSIGVAVIISRVWGIELTHLLSAVGVGSVVMGLALQNVFGNMVSGILLLSARQLSIGDFLSVAPGKAGLVKQIDWRSVTLEVSPTEILVLPSSSLTSSSFSVTDPGKPATLSVKVTIGYEYSPETVYGMLLEVARNLPQLVVTDEGVSCTVIEYGVDGIQYSVNIPVRHAGMFAIAQGEFLGRLWYAAQRHGISIASHWNLSIYGQTAEDRLALLSAAGAFRQSPTLLKELAEMGRLERWSSGETILHFGEKSDSVRVILRGSIRIFAQSGSEQIEIERIGTGQVFAIREVFRRKPSPVLATVAEESELLSCPVSAMQLLFNKDSGFAAEMETILETRAKSLKMLQSIQTA
jgi:small-conductance mechanosensitive channel